MLIFPHFKKKKVKYKQCEFHHLPYNKAGKEMTVLQLLRSYYD